MGFRNERKPRSGTTGDPVLSSCPPSQRAFRRAPSASVLAVLSSGRENRNIQGRNANGGASSSCLVLLYERSPQSEV